jgi:Tfp pilus assembly protein PilF
LRDTNAEAVLRRAIELKRDYWPAYAALSDHYKNMGQLAKSREVLEQGLSLSPDAKPLSTRLSQMRGRDVTKESRNNAPAE